MEPVRLGIFWGRQIGEPYESTECRQDQLYNYSQGRSTFVTLSLWQLYWNASSAIANHLMQETLRTTREQGPVRWVEARQGRIGSFLLAGQSSEHDSTKLQSTHSLWRNQFGRVQNFKNLANSCHQKSNFREKQRSLFDVGSWFKPITSCSSLAR